MTSYAVPDAPDARALAALIRSGELDPVEVVEASLARIDDVDGFLGAFVEVDAAGARHAAAAVRAALRAGDLLGPLAGVPVGVKDLFDVTGSHTRAGSAVPPDALAEQDALAVARLRDAGAVLVGRTRTHEFAWGITTQHAFLGGTRNPHATDRIPGGSSGGSAAAVAAGMVPLALGTDTACSLRLPAAFCGLVAHKPTHGLVPLTGVLPLSPSMDTGGALVRTVGDARFALELLSGRRLPPPEPVDGLRVGVAGSGGGLPLDRDVAAAYRAAGDAVDQLVGSVDEIRLPLGDRVVDAYRGVQAREALRWHRGTARWPQYADRYGPDVRARLAAAEEMSAAELDEAQALRSQLRDEMARVFERVDLLLMPVASTGPSTVDEPDLVRYRTGHDEGRHDEGQHDEGQHADLRRAVLPWTVPANLGGWPACSVPVGRDSDGLPIGVQIVGPAGSDARVLDLAAELEASLRW
jgi:aspartyl-tRNA(Asn)/glutamyl-tRNA(Gln) amidotransferase subunit A